MRKTKETNVTCPACGTQLAVTGNGVAAAVENKVPAKLPGTAQERIEALSRAGVDVSNLFAMQGSGGGEYVVSNKDGKLSILADDDPIFRAILSQGTVPNPRLFRRWITAQMFHMLSYRDRFCKEPVGVTEMIHRMGYEYQWKMLLDELHAQMKMEGRDAENFIARNRWFNVRVVEAMAQEYVEHLIRYVDELPVKKCKDSPYKRVGGENIFEQDLYNKLYGPLNRAAGRIRSTKNAAQLYNAVKAFDDLRVRLPHETPQCKAWVDAYKGAGAFYTMQNLIRFHGCTLIDDRGKHLDKDRSLVFLSLQADLYKNGGGWRMLAMLKKMLSDNGIDIQKKIKEWSQRKTK
ncbi:MAG: ubiquitin carboxyl-hydrolase [Alistipes sp.]|nr:ubiquitin carboxyl-hydrolase [Alistipes sp.]